MWRRPFLGVTSPQQPFAFGSRNHGQIRNRTGGYPRRGPALPDRAGPLRRRHRAAGHGPRRQRAVPARPRQDQAHRRVQGQGRAGRAGRADRRRCRGRKARRHDGAPDAGGFRRAQGPPHVPADAGVRPRPPCRRPRGLRRRRDGRAGARRGRTGRGRLRAASRGHQHRGRGQARRAEGVGRQPAGQQRLPPDVRQPGGDRRGLRQGQARGQAPRREQPHLAGVDGAARRDRRLRQRQRFLHALCGLAEPAWAAHGALARVPCGGEPDPRRLAGRRRRLRPQGRAVPRRSPGDVGVEEAPPPGEVGGEPQREHAQRPPRPRDGLLRGACARRERKNPRAAQQVAVPDGRVFRRRGTRGRRVLDPLRARGLRHPDHAHHVAGGVHQHLAERALSRRRPPRGGLLHGAAHRARGAPDRHGARGNPPPQSDPDRTSCPTPRRPTGSTTPASSCG